ncbi:MAG: hypothetical protein WAU01_11515 [Saprospiraceae bacterium]
MRSIIISLCLTFIFLLSVSDVESQVRKRPTSTSTRKKKEEKAPAISLMEKINPELKFGNLGFFNGLTISTKVNAGFKFSDRFSAGAGMKLFYDQYSYTGPDPSVLDIGALFYGRAKITQEIYFQGEYALMGYAKDPDGYTIRGYVEKQKVNYPLFGLGYTSGMGKWRFGIELLYIASEQARDIQGSVVEYWFGASYNF